MSTLKPGFNTGISNEDYHAEREYISSSGLKLILNDPKEYYKRYILGEDTGSFNQEAMDFGTYIHGLILEPHLLEGEFAIFEGLMKEGKEWEEFEKTIGERILIMGSQKIAADKLIKKFNKATILLGDPGEEKEVKVSSFFEGGDAEQSLCGEINGVKIKVRFDYRKESENYASVNDIKTSSYNIGTKKGAEKVCNMYSYDLSAALYVDLAEQVTGKKHDFYFTFISKKHLPTIKIYKASEKMLESGRKKYLKAIEKIKIARATNVYYTNTIQELDSDYQG